MTLRRLPAVLPALLLFAPLCAQAPATVTERIIEEGLRNSGVMAFQDQLCNGIGARLTGSDAFATACAWARDEFAAMGLDARLEQWGEWNLAWNRGQWSGRVLEPVELELQVATPAWTAATRGRVAGTLVAMPTTLAEIEALQPRLSDSYVYGPKPRGKAEEVIALRDALDALFEQTPPLGFVTASRHGGIDQNYPTQIRVFGDSMVARGSWESRPKTPEIVVRDDQARHIEALLGSGQPVRVEFDIRNRFRQGPIELHNVVADLRGTEQPDEYVIVCGHLDSWHQATGATDNGTGSATTLEAARILTAAAAAPKRTIRFILWGGEEQGLLGSHRHVVMHRTEMPNVSAVFNNDSGTNWVQSLTVTEAMFGDFAKVLEPVMQLASPDPKHDGPVFELRKTEKMGVGLGSDHASFQSAGVPAWQWGLSGRADYSYGWHSQWDTYDIVIPEYQKHSSTVVALVSLGIADLPHLLSREGLTLDRDAGEHSTEAYLTRLFGISLDKDNKLVVSAVREDGPAARAGVQVGDRIRAVWGEPVSSASEMFGPWRDHRDDKAVAFTVERAGERLVLEGAKAAPEQGTDTKDGAKKSEAGSARTPVKTDNGAAGPMR